MNIIDLSVPFVIGEDLTVRRRENPPVYCGHECYAWDIAIQSHCGSYFETAGHVFRHGACTDSVPLDELIVPGMCVRFDQQRRCIEAADLERLAGDIPKRWALLVDTGGDTTVYFSRDAGVWMADKNIALMGSNTARYDTGFENPTGFFVPLFEAGIPIVHGVRSLEALPRTGFTLMVMPLKISNVGTVPCRIAAMVDARSSRA